MSRHGLERRGSLAVGHVYLTVTSTTTDEQVGSVAQILDEYDVPDRSIVHRQLRLLA